MALILIKGPGGIRRVEEGFVFRLALDEKVIGSEKDEVDKEISEELTKAGMGLGDFIERAIKLVPESVRPKHCSKCEKRKLVLNKVREIGVKETFNRLRKIG